MRLAAAIGAVAAVIVLALTYGVRLEEHRAHVVRPHSSHQSTTLPVKPDSYVGVYQSGAPDSYAGVARFTAKTGIKPRLVVYYSGWFEPFKASFATTAAEHGAVPLVQIDPKDVSLAAIASGHYDSYLNSYAEAVRSYHRPVILGFGHEMNGNWYSWGYRHTSPAVFVAAWRHIVTLFRDRGARNVTWLWTVNIVHTGGSIRQSGTLVARQQVRDLGGAWTATTTSRPGSSLPCSGRPSRPYAEFTHAPMLDSRDIRSTDHEPAGEDR